MVGPRVRAAGRGGVCQRPRAGFRLRFRATVLRLRAQFPRIVVRYDATEDGNAAKPLLPDVGTAYLTMDQVAPRDW